MLLARSESAYLLFHRGITHSLVGLLLLPPLLAAGLWWGLGRSTRFAWLLLLCWAGAVLHVAYDMVTPWGTMLLYPFDLARFSFDWLFIVDLFTWLLPALAVLAAWRRPERSRAAAAAFLVAMATYVLLSGYAHGAALRATVAAERAAGRRVAEAFAIPELLAPWRWQGLAVAAANAPEPRITRYAIDGLPPRTRSVERIARGFDDPWARRALETPEGQAYLWWASIPIARVDAGGDTVAVALGDLRFRRRLVAATGPTPFSIHFTFDAATGELERVRW